MNIALNQESRLFVISTGNSTSCLGFSVVFEQARELMARIARISKQVGQPPSPLVSLEKLLPVKEEEVGTLAQYEQYSTLLSMYRQMGDKETWFDARTPKEVRRVLERYRKSEGMLRVYTGCADTGRDGLAEFGTIGRIGRSMGPMMVPLLVEEGEYGGAALLTDSIVRLQDCTTGLDVYRHKQYHVPPMEVEVAPSYDQALGYTHVVKVCESDNEWQVYARFHSHAKACHWVAFMAGESHDLPD